MSKKAILAPAQPWRAKNRSTSKSLLVDSVKDESTSHENGLIEVELREGLNEGFNLDQQTLSVV